MKKITYNLLALMGIALLTSCSTPEVNAQDNAVAMHRVESEPEPELKSAWNYIPNERLAKHVTEGAVFFGKVEKPLTVEVMIVDPNGGLLFHFLEGGKTERTFPTKLFTVLAVTESGEEYRILHANSNNGHAIDGTGALLQLMLRETAPIKVMFDLHGAFNNNMAYAFWLDPSGAYEAYQQVVENKK
jgi:hypothetical protein